MLEGNLATDRIDSWKDIAAYLRRDVRTVIRWEKEKGLPVHRVPGGHRQSIFSYKHELDQWLAGGSDANQSGDPVAGLPSSPAPEALSPSNEIPTVSLSQPASLAVPTWRRASYLSIGFMTAILLMAAAYQYHQVRSSLQTPQFFGQEQLTENGQEKLGLLTDGKTLYFGQEQDGHFALASMPVDGGQIRFLWSPPANVLPVDISQDGKKILAMTSLSVERERELWIVPLDHGEPHRLSTITARSAAWAPDNKTIAYASRSEIYLISEGESAPTQIGSFALIPDALQWSDDGQRLHFVLQDIPSEIIQSWGTISGSDMKTITLRAEPPSLGHFGASGHGDGSDSYYVAGNPLKPGSTPIWRVHYGKQWWEPAMQIAPIHQVIGGINGIAFVKKSNRLLVLGVPLNRTSFLRFDARAQGFWQILPGVSGSQLDYSRDAKWVAYCSSQDNSLWLSRADGTMARQLTFPPEVVELPRWSPDGKQIAYMSQRDGLPWRIRVMQPDSGASKSASEGNDSQGAPTWSPDGRSLVYGNVNCEETHTCSIHQIDLATGKVQTLPGSEGLFTARWSPDGRFVAALHLENHQIFVFDIRARHWSKLADSVDGVDLSWSADSRYLYTNLRGANAGIFRFSVPSGSREEVLDLSAQNSYELAEEDDLGFALAPDDSLILHQRSHSWEIYSYDLRFP